MFPEVGKQENIGRKQCFRSNVSWFAQGLNNIQT